jgi:caffeoyl-CoA O-methyltransferase
MLILNNNVLCLTALVTAGFFIICLIGAVFAKMSDHSKLDARISEFIESMRSKWSDWNVSGVDGKVLYDLILKGNHKNIIEIGTSTGHSTIWLAWAAAKTGGKVITIEAHKERYDIALENFKNAGVADYIDARLGNGHELVPQIQSPVDFVFCDADKDWYLNYFQILEQKISINGCFTAHNVLWAGRSNINRFLEYLKKTPDFHSYLEKGSGEGISISCKIR